ncbi:hypothetical protein [Phormidium sp. FACHB-592]|nr:hypothetical protein [Phormidium sp. FACHB-592]
MKKWNALSQLVLALALVQAVLVVAIALYRTRTPPTVVQGTHSPAARKVSSVNDDLSLVLSSSSPSDKGPSTVVLSCLSQFVDLTAQLEAKRALIALLASSNNEVYLDDLVVPTAPTATERREVHLTTGTFVQTELAATGWVQFKQEPGCRAAKTIALVSRRAQQAGSGGWKR